MRWIKQKEPSVGDIRVITKFALFPESCELDNGDMERRWLEFVTIEQRYTREVWGTWGERNVMYHWKNIRFVDKEENVDEMVD